MIQINYKYKSIYEAPNKSMLSKKGGIDINNG
jgi:hypothetical protein